MFWKLRDHLNDNLDFTILDLIPLGLSTWRLSNALVYERGPFDIFIKLREATGIKHNFFGERTSWTDTQVLSCIWCTSFWVAVLMVIFGKPFRYVFSASALAILVEEILFKEKNKEIKDG